MSLVLPPGYDQNQLPDGISWAEHLSAVCPLMAWTGGLEHCRWCDAELTAASFPEFCDYTCRGRWRYNHDWGFARKRALNQANHWCSIPRCRNRDLQVNHIVELVGRGYFPGCVHHQDNLEVLCGAHHSMETTRQLRERRGIPTETREVLLALAAKQVAQTSYCGARLLNGGRCSRWVEPGTKCWQHALSRGQRSSAKE